MLNAAGEVEMDAVIMDGRDLRLGAVACVQDIQHPVSLARMVMDKVVQAPTVVLFLVVVGTGLGVSVKLHPHPHPSIFKFSLKQNPLPHPPHPHHFENPGLGPETH